MGRWASIAKVRRWLPLARKLGVSTVARSRGFTRAFLRAGGRAKLSERWKLKREAFVARHTAQVRKRREPLWARDRDGRLVPTRRHLALLMWAWQP